MTTKAQLLELIAHLPDDAEIMFQRPSGDYWKTDLVESPDRLEEVEVAFNTYHDQDAVVDSDRVDSEDGQRYYDGKLVRTVFVLS